MERKRLSRGTVERWTSDFPNLALKRVVIRCKECQCVLSNKVKTKYLSTDRHKLCLRGHPSTREQQIQFNQDLLKMIISCNMPWTTLQNLVFRQFLANCTGGKYSNVSLPSEGTLITHISPTYNKYLREIGNDLRDKNIWVAVNELVESENRTIVHILVGGLDETGPMPARLIASKVLYDTTSDIISHCVDSSFQDVWGNDLQNIKKRVLLYITDSSYHLKVSSEILKFTYQYENLTHLICLAHGLHCVAATIKYCYPEVDGLIDEMKRIFLKEESGKNLFEAELPNIPLPPEPDVMHCSTWLEAASYYYVHFNTLKRMINIVNMYDALDLSYLRQLFCSTAVQKDLQYIHSNFSRIYLSVKQLEVSTMVSGYSIVNCANTVFDLRQFIYSLSGTSAELARNSFSEVLSSNTGFPTLSAITDLFTAQNQTMDSEVSNADICRVCRSEGVADRPLFHPCICTGSIKWIHQECLMQWMRYSRKEYCELCGHRFSFTPIYSPDMPRRLPLRDLTAGLLSSIATAVKYWLHYTLVATAWLGLVPLTACRIYRALFTGTLDAILTLPFNILSTENIAADIFQGCFVVTCTLFAFAGLVWLREQILHGGGPDWMQRDNIVHQAEDPPRVLDNIPEEGAEDADGNNGPRAEWLREHGPEWLAGNNAGAQVQNNVQPQERGDYANVQPDLAGRWAAGGPDWLQGDNVVPQAAEGPPNVAPERGDYVEHELPGAAGAPLEDHQAQVEGDGNVGEDNNWIPMEWDRAAEEITWERLLGLDGSLMFLEHVFWVISLNTLFILIFAYSPYHMGLLTLSMFNMRETASASHFEGLLTTLVGYCSVGIWFVVLHRIAGWLGFNKAKRVLGLCYVVVKVSMLSVVEIGIIPLVCGWWLDICSLAMFDATLKDREASFSSAPGTSIFIHWLIGMVYVYYFASFILLLREILRPGVLWFLRNFNDPDFSPIQEMIHLPILEHIRKLLISAVIFGSAVLLMLWLPIRILKMILPSFLPYTVSLNNDTQVNELSLELLLLQVILPALLEQSHTRIWLKGLVRNWCKVVAWILNIHSYLLGDGDGKNREEGQNGNGPVGNAPEAGAGLGAVHQALLMMEPPTGFQPYQRPSFFIARLVGLLIAVCISLIVSSLMALTLPVWLGRRVMALWLVGAPPPSPQISAKDAQTEVKVHELYTAACGLYLCWLAARAVSLVLGWLPQGRAAMVDRLKQWCILGAKTIVASTILLGVIPLLFGLLLELVVIIPLRVPIHQTPILFIWQDWALGVLYTKIACAITMMGPDWFLRAAIERAYRDGIRDMNLTFIFKELAAPVIISFGLALSIPYVLAYSVVPVFVANLQMRNFIARRIYPFLLLLCVLVVIVCLQIRQFKKLYEHIKNDKYLVGQRLVNYDHRKKTQAAN